MKKAVERYARKRIKRLRQFLESYMESDKPEILHHLRVEIKKIKMLIGLLHFQNPKLDKQHTFRPFRKVFKLAGEIRDPELHSLLARELTGESLIDDHDRAGLMEHFRRSTPKYVRVIKKREIRLLKEVMAITTQTYEQYLRQMRKKLKAILNRNYNTAQLHPARKLIKVIYYLESITKAKKTINPFYVDAARIIGDWHDKMMLIEKLHASGKPHKPALDKLQTKCTEDLTSLKTLIREFYG